MAGYFADREAGETDRLIYERVRLGIMSALSVNREHDVRGAQGAAANDRRQLEHPRAQARRRGLRRLQEALRRSRAEDRVQLDRQGQANVRAPSRTHGSADPRGERHLRAMHTAIIMDGNGRWAERRGLPRSAGHRAGAKAVRRIVEAATRGPIDILTLYAFSSDNWSRPPQEVANLMRLLKRYLVSETARCLDNGVRLSVIGRRDRLSRDLVRTIENTERLTAGGTKLHLRLAVDYSARAAIAAAAARAHSPEDFERELAAAVHSDVDAPVDLLIRTGGERRLERLLALGIRVCGARVRRHVLARLRRSRIRCRAARVCAARSPLRAGLGSQHAGRFLARRVAPLRLQPATQWAEAAVAPHACERGHLIGILAASGGVMSKPPSRRPPGRGYTSAEAKENNNEGRGNPHSESTRSR